MQRIAVIGTAGRGTDRSRLSRSLYLVMCQDLSNRLARIEVNPESLHLVSSGAAWADHLAVLAYLKDRAANLTLYLPCPITTEGQYLDTGETDFRTNPGHSSNRYHREFSQAMGWKNSIVHILEAQERGASLIVGKGFFDRNQSVAQCEIMIAYTWGVGTEPKDGGTRHTWDYCNAPHKIHVPLRSLVPKPA